MRRWAAEHGGERGEIVGLDALWTLAEQWYRDRLRPEWSRRPPSETQAMFASLGFVGAFWELERR